MATCVTEPRLSKGTRTQKQRAGRSRADCYIVQTTVNSMAKKRRLNTWQLEARKTYKAFLKRGKKAIINKPDRGVTFKGNGNN
jgi:hypothetical protein